MERDKYLKENEMKPENEYHWKGERRLKQNPGGEKEKKKKREGGE
jgi:hypothetical protein